jgi:hypothetical protein
MNTKEKVLVAVVLFVILTSGLRLAWVFEDWDTIRELQIENLELDIEIKQLKLNEKQTNSPIQREGV